MKKTWMTFPASCLAAAVVLLSAPPAGAREAISWRPSFAKAMEEAGSKGRPVMVDFFTEWCGWCKRLDATTYADRAVGKACDKIVCVKVNAEKQREIAQRYSVNSYPTIVFLDSGGAFVDRIVGYLPPEGFKTRLEEILAAHRKFEELAASFDGDNATAVAAASFASECLKRQRPQPAERAVRRIESQGQKAGDIESLWIEVGYLYGSQGKLREAASCAGHVLSKYPKSRFAEAAHFLHGAASADLGDLPTARTHLTWVKERGSDPQLRPRAETLLAKMDATKAAPVAN